jgi:hypothetical protein
MNTWFPITDLAGMMGSKCSVGLFTKTPVHEKVMEASAEKAKQFIKHACTSS